MARRERGAWSSAFASDLSGYIEYKRGLNYKATSAEEAYAPSFDRFCREKHPDKEVLDMELALAWVADARGETASAAACRASFMRELARYLILEGKDACVLPAKATAVARTAPAPRILAWDELAALFAAADGLEAAGRAGLRHLMAPVAFRLMYCAGLRPYEARTLEVDRFDLDAGVIHVVDSKGKDRDVPVKRDIADMCAEYSDRAEALLPGRAAFFPNRDGSAPWSWHCMSGAFRLCWERAGLAGSAGPQPVLYSLRHTFATDCISRWRAQGIDVEGNLPLLQAYMGHERIERTLYYVHLVRRGLGDPAPYESWEPANRMEGVAVDG